MQEAKIQIEKAIGGCGNCLLPSLLRRELLKSSAEGRIRHEALKDTYVRLRL
jgi:hypothetical protein